MIESEGDGFAERIESLSPADVEDLEMVLSKAADLPLEPQGWTRLISALRTAVVGTTLTRADAATVALAVARGYGVTDVDVPPKVLVRWYRRYHEPFSRLWAITVNGADDWQSLSLEMERRVVPTLGLDEDVVRMTIDKEDGRTVVFVMGVGSYVELLSHVLRDTPANLPIRGAGLSAWKIQELRARLDEFAKWVEALGEHAPSEETGEIARAT